ncbi:hypothetical protein KEJ23_08145 [Candidatus Bathyarchaeota archaeon]|nr:hypothetical protein [Candidatus Bathyarchaeota archaeon]
MKILALDIGSGTTDILLYDDSKNLENCIKMVLPSPSTIYAEKVRYYTELRRDLFIRGDTIGGGPFAEALRRHLEEGLRVTMTADAGYTVRNSLEEVKRLGIAIEDSPPKDFGGEILQIREIDIDKFRVFIECFGEDLSHVHAVGVGVQDHGVPPRGGSNRKFRMVEMEERLRKNLTLESLAYLGEEVPKHHIRMRSALNAVRTQLPEAKPVIIDTSIASILGCLQDPKVRKAGTVLTVNMGNEHLTASIVSGGKVFGLLEHHIHILTPRKVEKLLKRFMEGKVDGTSVLEEGGHGAFYTQNPPAIPKIGLIAVTGPNRSIVDEMSLKTYLAAPGGDMMMTGPIGIVKAAEARILKHNLKRGDGAP